MPRKQTIWLDPKLVAGAVQAGRAVGWRKFVPLLALGVLAATVGMEWAGRSKPATTGTATAPVAAKVNLNTATAAQIDKLPKMTHAQSKAIVEARAKAKFKDWDDFVARKLVPANEAAAIKDVVTF